MKPQGRRRRHQPAADPTVDMTDAEKAEYTRRRLLATPIAELPIGVRTVNVLEANDIILVADLVRRTEAELTAGGKLGANTYRELYAAVAALGLAVPAGWGKPRPGRGARKKEKRSW